MNTEIDVGNRRGPKAQRGAVAERILRHARVSFAERGYAATTLQGVARAAGVHTKLVRYYFTSKEDLFEECLVVPEAFLTPVRLLSNVPPSERGVALVRTHLAAWDDTQLALFLRTCLLIAAHEPTAMAKVRAVFVDVLIPAIAEGIPADERQLRGGLVASQLLGLAFARFIFQIDQTAAIPDDEIIHMVGATIQHYIDGPLSGGVEEDSRHSL